MAFRRVFVCLLFCVLFCAKKDFVSVKIVSMESTQGACSNGANLIAYYDRSFLNFDYGKKFFGHFSAEFLCVRQGSVITNIRLFASRSPGLLCLSLIRLCFACALSVCNKCTYTSANKWVRDHRWLFVSRRSKTQLRRLRCTLRRSSTAIVLCVILISGDIHLNPGPTTRSITAFAATPQLRELPAFISLAPTQLQRINTPGDGHCLFHAVSLSLKHLYDLSLPTALIINLVQNELLTHFIEYSSFGFSSENIFQSQVRQYLTYRRYNSAIGDLGPLAVANALAIRIYITDEVSSAVHLRATVNSRLPVGDSQYIILHYHVDHYSGIFIRGLAPVSSMRNSASASPSPIGVHHAPASSTRTFAATSPSPIGLQRAPASSTSTSAATSPSSIGVQRVPASSTRTSAATFPSPISVQLAPASPPLGVSRASTSSPFSDASSSASLGQSQLSWPLSSNDMATNFTVVNLNVQGLLGSGCNNAQHSSGSYAKVDFCYIFAVLQLHQM